MATPRSMSTLNRIRSLMVCTVIVGTLFGVGSSASAGPCNDEPFGSDVWNDTGGGTLFVGLTIGDGNMYAGGHTQAGACVGVANGLVSEYLAVVYYGDGTDFDDLIANPTFRGTLRRCKHDGSGCSDVVGPTGNSSPGFDPACSVPNVPHSTCTSQTIYVSGGPTEIDKTGIHVYWLPGLCNNAERPVCVDGPMFAVYAHTQSQAPGGQHVALVGSPNATPALTDPITVGPVCVLSVCGPPVDNVPTGVVVDTGMSLEYTVTGSQTVPLCVSAGPTGC